jgi:hypothetical protein
MPEPVWSKLPFVAAATCPRCLGRARLVDRRTCCSCQSTGRIVTMEILAIVVGFMWAVPGCDCYTCRAVVPRQPQFGASQPAPA